jgi:tryptophan synthase alpha chain
MINRIEAKFNDLRGQGRKALIPYIMAGDPDLPTTGSLVYSLEAAGADLIELGVPFSDPLADGPTIQRAGERSLRQGTSLKKILRLIRELRKRTQIPLILMTYYNLIYQFGVDRFAHDAVEAGVDGVIIPDLPPEEAGDLVETSRKSGLATVFLIAPTSPIGRIQRIVSVASGFVYYVSLTGITGAKLRSLSAVREKVQEIRHHTSLPIAVGFGISTPREAAQVSRWADGVIIGSALVGALERARGNPVRAAERFIREMRKAVP